jgi:transposase-like protein
MNAKRPAVRRRVRRRFSAQDRERLIAEQAQSGLTIKAFCEREGLKPWTLYGWRKKPRARQPRFAEVEVAPCLVADVEVLLPNGARVGIRHQGQRAELVALVREVAGC